MTRRDFNPAVPEQMDLPQPVSRELEIDLENLVRINRNFGGHRLIRYFLRRWLKPGKPWRVLDLCTASGDIPRLLVDYALARGIEVTVDAVDFQAATLEIGRRHSAAYPEITFREGDARTVSGEVGSYDLVICSLALHHFSEEDAILVLRRCRELARGPVLVADLRRGWSAELGVWLITELLYREPMTKFDARLSVRRAFSDAELAGLARLAGWPAFRQARFPIARQAIWLD